MPMLQGDNAEDCARNAISSVIPRQPSWRCQSSSMFPGALNVPQLRPLQKVEKALPWAVLVTWTQKLCFCRRQAL